MTVVDLLSALSLLVNLTILALLLTGALARMLRNAVAERLATLEKHQERLDALWREDIAALRQEQVAAHERLRDTISQHFEMLARHLKDQEQAAESLRQERLDALYALIRESIAAERERLDTFSDQTHQLLRQHDHLFSELIAQQQHHMDAFREQMVRLTEMNATKLQQIEDTVHRQLTQIQQDNSEKLEKMRATVDEKLHHTLEQRLGDSFKLVSDRLEQVQKGLGEMQTLASGVGDLKKVLTNVKTRGTLGEMQLDSILEQILTPAQYESKVAVRPGSQERVDFAIKLPGRQDNRDIVWLPIDAKFPLEDYQRLCDAEEAGDVLAVQNVSRKLELRIRDEAKSIRDKYVNPPDTTDFALMFLPVEGLFAEVLRRPGLWDSIQRDFRIVICGPTTITALLNSLNMGFRTLAIQQRSSEVWKLLGAVKTEFTKFGEMLEKTQKKLQEASHSIESATTRTRAIERKLVAVEAARLDSTEHEWHLKALE
ncbi:MAG: DNA recombination protein RmuC [Firmicutes bacterium]|nr:DNA recombination protein RmuC [Bacillota bacterium]